MAPAQAQGSASPSSTFSSIHPPCSKSLKCRTWPRPGWGYQSSRSCWRQTKLLLSQAWHQDTTGEQDLASAQLPGMANSSFASYRGIK